MGKSHVAQPSYLALSYFGEVLLVARYAVAYVPGSFRDFPAPRSAAYRQHGFCEVLASALVAVTQCA